MSHTIAIQGAIITVLLCAMVAICIIGVWREMWTQEKERQLQATVLAQVDTITRLKLKIMELQNVVFLERVKKQP